MADIVQQSPPPRVRSRIGIPQQNEVEGVANRADRPEPIGPGKAVKPVSVTSIQVSVETFLDYVDNPKQRDTERHASIATKNHLKDASPAQARVAAAQIGDTIYKLDGHTRSYLWASGRLDRPTSVNVDLYRCDTLEQVLELYDAFDNRFAAETVQDRLSSALRLSKVEVKSSFFKTYAFSSAFSTLINRHISTQELARHTAAYANEILMLDSINPSKKVFRSGVIAGSLLLLARYGERILPFLQAFNTNQGIKFATECDGVQALHEYVTNHSFKGGYGDSVMMMRKTLSCGERWIAGTPYKTSSGPANIKETEHRPYLKKLA